MRRLARRKSFLVPGFHSGPIHRNLSTHMMSSQPQRAVLTPCTGVCSLDLQGFCEGCQRTGTEIAGWLQMSDEERLRMMEEVLPAREAGQG